VREDDDRVVAVLTALVVPDEMSHCRSDENLF
jgi:hypothetical protein